MTATVSDTLNLAADLIEQRGWTRGGGNGSWHPEDGSTTPLCVEGALNAVLGIRSKWKCPAWRAVASYIAGRPGVEINPASGLPIVFAWNDYPGRTATGVVEVLRACAVLEASRERESVAVSA